MNVREMLKKDFGIEVRIEGGCGTRADPFKVEACTQLDATKTQLNLLRGLGHGRREIWRLKDVEPHADGNGSLNRAGFTGG